MNNLTGEFNWHMLSQRNWPGHQHKQDPRVAQCLASCIQDQRELTDPMEYSSHLQGSSGLTRWLEKKGVIELLPLQAVQ